MVHNQDTQLETAEDTARQHENLTSSFSITRIEHRIEHLMLETMQRTKYGMERP